jgi:hypothetical protein
MEWDLLDAAEKCFCPCDDCKSTTDASTMSSFISSVTSLIPSAVPEDDVEVNLNPAFVWQTDRLMPELRQGQGGMHQNYDEYFDDEEEEEEFNYDDDNEQYDDDDEEIHTGSSVFPPIQERQQSSSALRREDAQIPPLDQASFQQYILPILRASMRPAAAASATAPADASLREAPRWGAAADDRASSSMWAEIVATDNGNGQFTAIFGISRFGGEGTDSSELNQGDDVLRINVDRKDLLVSTFKSIESRINTLDRWSESRAPRVSVKFADESGYGEGVLRDWITSVMTEIYSPEAGIFRQVSHRVVHPRGRDALDGNLASVATPSKWGWLAGFVTGVAVRANVSTGYHLSDAFASMVLGRRPTNLDKASIEIDNDIAATCRKTLEATPEDLNSMGLTFEYEENGLLPDGSGQGIQVTRYNRDLFTKLVHARICGTDDVHGLPASISREFRKGFMQGVGYDTDVHSKSLWNVTVRDFNETLGGSLEITSEDILSKVQFCQGRNVNRQSAEELVEGFKQHVRDMSDEQRRALLRFWTGSLAPIVRPDPPRNRATMLGGRSISPATNMQLVVIEDHGEGRRPYSHTCYQQLTLPMAETTVETLARLDEAIANCEAIVD